MTVEAPARREWCKACYGYHADVPTGKDLPLLMCCDSPVLTSISLVYLQLQDSSCVGVRWWESLFSYPPSPYGGEKKTLLSRPKRFLNSRRLAWPFWPLTCHKRRQTHLTCRQESITLGNIPNTLAEHCKLSRCFKHLSYHYDILSYPRRWVCMLLICCPS